MTLTIEELNEAIAKAEVRLLIELHSSLGSFIVHSKSDNKNFIDGDRLQHYLTMMIGTKKAKQ